MNILFIYPSYPETFWSFSHVMKFIRIFTRKAPFPPLGIATVSSLLPGTWNKRMVDMTVTSLHKRDIEWADLVMVSAMEVQRESVKKVTARIKAMGKPVAVGGPLFSEETMDEYPHIDHFILGEGEMSLPPFITEYQQGTAKRFYRVNEKPDLRNTPLPDWSLINFRNYATMMVQYSRGCPFDCEFCDITKLNGRIPRTKSPEQIVAELDALKNAGWRGTVFFVDDNFIGNKQKVKKALHAIIAWMKEHDYPFTFLTEASINLADDDELISLMVEANFNSIFLGLETPDEQTLLECNKLQNTKLNPTAAVKKLQQCGIQVQAGFIVGFDSDDHTIFDRQIQFIQKSGVGVAMVGLLTALRGTKLHSRLEKEGRLLTESSGNNTDGHLNFIPKMDPELLVSGYKRIIQTIYAPKEYAERVCTFIDEYKPRYQMTKLKRRDIVALVRSIFYLGIFNRAGYYYWKVVFHTVSKNPKAFPDVISLLLVGFHCRKVAHKL